MINTQPNKAVSIPFYTVKQIAEHWQCSEKTIRRLIDRCDLIAHRLDVPELRIVDDTLWDRVKRRQDPMTRDTRPDRKEPIQFWEKARPRYLLSGLMKCGSCGGGYVKVSANAFGCATARNKGTCDNRLTIRRDTLEATILDGLKTRLMEPPCSRYSRLSF